jgi:hypothetical protein
MKDPFPTFLDSEDTLSAETIFRPFPPNRRGEFIAWSSAVVVGLVTGLLSWQSGRISSLAIFLFVFFSLSAIIISFGNWMEAHTLIRLSPEHVVYQSPVRKVTLALNDVRELWVSSAGRGWRIAVRGEGGYFSYRSAVRLGGRRNQGVYIGIEHGDRLAALIRSVAQLSPPVFEEGVWLCKKGS